jgi:signal transduction histidine kinase
VDFIRLERENADSDDDYLRVSAANGSRLVDLTPTDQAPLPADLSLEGASPGVQWVLLPEGREGTLVEMAYRSLSGGGTIAMGRDASERERLLRQFRVIFAGIMAPVALVGLAAGFILARRMLTPIQGLIDTVRAIDTGRMDARVPAVGADDELNELARLFNAMLDKIKSLLTGMREALDNVAHDLRTPATRVLAAIEASATKAIPRNCARPCSTAPRRPGAWSTCSASSWTSPRPKPASCACTSAPRTWPSWWPRPWSSTSTWPRKSPSPCTPRPRAPCRSRPMPTASARCWPTCSTTP